MSKWDKETIISLIQKFYNEHDKSPVDKDFYKSEIYPNPTSVKYHFGTWNNALLSAGVPINRHNKLNYWNKNTVIESIQKFYKVTSTIPEIRDFKKNAEYPSITTVSKLFGSWNNAIEAAGFTPNIQNGYGYDTFGLDGHLYRSKAEAYFADSYLYNKFQYVVEPKYPHPYNKYYDWFISSLDLYIELDGEIRPETTKEK